jgi:hypothetical protein
MLATWFANQRSRIVVLCVIVSLLTLALLVVPFTSTSSPLCSLRMANAQDNPCLAQQATISALQGLLIQSTLDHSNDQATLAALMSQLHANPAPTVKPAVGLPFDDKFADNHNGWDTTTHPTGKATISDNKLTIMAHATQGLSLVIPGLTISDHFYAEATVTDNGGSLTSALIGFVVGNVDKNDVVSFTVDVESKDTQIVTFYDNHPGTAGKLVQSTHPGLADPTKPVVVGLEANGNVFTFFVNGHEADAVRINPVGQQLGITYTNSDGGDLAVNFTEVLVRESH